MTTTPKWVQSELNRVHKERKDAFEAKGWKEFFTFPVGTTLIRINMSVEPRKTSTGKPILRGIVDSVEYDVPLTPVVYGAVIEGINKGCVEFEVTRVGKGKSDTRYGVEPVE